MDKTNYRKERIDRLLHELRYEIERGIFDGEIDERMSFRFIVPISHTFKGGVVIVRVVMAPARDLFEATGGRPHDYPISEL